MCTVSHFAIRRCRCCFVTVTGSVLICRTTHTTVSVLTSILNGLWLYSHIILQILLCCSIFHVCDLYYPISLDEVLMKSWWSLDEVLMKYWLVLMKYWWSLNEVLIRLDSSWWRLDEVLMTSWWRLDEVLMKSWWHIMLMKTFRRLILIVNISKVPSTSKR